MSRLLVVGAGHEQVPMLKRARERGLYVVACDGNPQASGAVLADEFHVISTRDVEGILGLARSRSVNGVTSWITETALPAIEQVTWAMGLPGPPPKAVATTVDKGVMRSILEGTAVPGLAYAAVSSLVEALQASGTIGFPMVVKPATESGQRGVSKVSRPEELEGAVGSALKASGSGGILLERFVDGPELNVVALFHRGSVVAFTVSDRITCDGGSFGIVSRHLYPVADQKRVEPGIRAVLEALGRELEIEDGVLYPQIMWTLEGPVLIELGFRVPGGKVQEIFELATGYDLLDIQINGALGVLGDLDRYRKHPGHPAVTVRFLNGLPGGTLRPGVVRHISGLESARRLPGVVEVDFFGPPSDPRVVRPLLTGIDRFIHIIAVGASREEAVDRSEAAVREIQVETVE